LLTQGVEGAFTGRVGGGHELCHVGASQWAVIVEGILENTDDSLLQGDDLGLKLVLGDGWRVSVSVSSNSSRHAMLAHEHKLTITPCKPTPHAPIHVVVHCLHHSAVALKVVADLITGPATALETVDFVLALLSLALGLVKLLAQLFDLAVLLRVALLLLVLLTAVGHALPQAHGGGEGADERRGERGAYERLLELLLLDPWGLLERKGGTRMGTRTHMTRSSL
jgi:hypothetical protein